MLDARGRSAALRMMLAAGATWWGAGAPAGAQPAAPEPGTPGAGVPGDVEPAVTRSMQRGQQLIQQGNFAEAIGVFRAITEEQPDAGGAWFLLGYALHADGQIAEAAVVHERAAGFPQVAGNAMYNLGCARALLGDADAAFAALRRAADLGVSLDVDWEADRDLASLRGDPRWATLIERVAMGGGFPTALRFWVGDWDVYTTAGALGGRNTLSLRVGGNVIHEAWTPAGGGPAGESWNWYDPALGVWHQAWVDASGVRTHFTGTPLAGGVLFEGLQVGPSGTASLARMHVRPIEGGRVRQTGTGSSDGGETWEPRYDLIYVPTGEAFGAAGGGTP